MIALDGTSSTNRFPDTSHSKLVTMNCTYSSHQSPKPLAVINFCHWLAKTPSGHKLNQWIILNIQTKFRKQYTGNGHWANASYTNMLFNRGLVICDFGLWFWLRGLKMRCFCVASLQVCVWFALCMQILKHDAYGFLEQPGTDKRMRLPCIRLSSTIKIIRQLR